MLGNFVPGRGPRILAGMTVIQAHYSSMEMTSDLLGVQGKTLARTAMHVKKGDEAFDFVPPNQEAYALVGSTAQGVLHYANQGRMAKSRKVSDQL